MFPKKNWTMFIDYNNRYMNFLHDILRGNQLAAGRLIKLVEDDDSTADDVLKALYPHAGNALVVGITGFPGAGKSTLINRPVAKYRKKGRTVAVLAFDPSSSITGGAILGARIRMQRHSIDLGVFLRSIATRDIMDRIVKPIFKETE